MSKLRLRKCVGILTMLATLLLALPVVVAAPAEISIESCGANYDTTVIAPINITDASGVGAATIKLHYDKDVVIVDSVPAGDMGGLLTPAINNAIGVTTIGWISSTGLEGNHVLAYVELHAVGSGGATSPLDLEVVTFADAYGAPIENTTEDGVFTVTAPAAGLVAEAGGPYSGIAGSSVSLSGSATGGTPGYTYAWDLNNDGTYETSGKDVNYTWTESGDYTVGLKVTDKAHPKAKDTDTADVSISAAAPSYYTLTVTCEPAAYGSVTLTPTQPGGGYVAGTSVELTAVANAGYTFDSWSGALSGSANPTNIIMDSNKTVTANFEEVIVTYYTLTVTCNLTEGSVTCDPAPPYVAGTSVELTAVANAGYTFDSWSGALSGSANPTNIIMDSNKTVTANFEEVIVTYYTLTVTCNLTEGSVTRDPAPPYVAGTSVELTAVANAGYKFDSWGGELSGSANPTNIIMDSPKTVTANFAQIPPTETPVTGNVVEGLYIDVTAPSPIELGDMLQGATTTGHSATPGSVDTNYETWSAKAKDETNGGYMKLSDSTPLTNKLQIGKSEGVCDVDADFGIDYGKVTSLPFYVSQTVELGDAIGSYSITITFTALP